MDHFRSFPDSFYGVSGAGAARRAGLVCDSQARSRPEAHHTGWWPVLAWEATLWGLAGVSRGVYLADADAGVARAGAGLVDLDLQARVPLAVVFVGAGGQAAGQETRIPFGQGFGGVLGVFALYGAAGEGLAVLPLPGLAVQGVRGGGGGEGGDRVADGVYRSSGSSVRLPATVVVGSPAG